MPLIWLLLTPISLAGFTLSTPSGLEVSGTKQAGFVWADFNEDGWPDLLVNMANSSKLFFNDGGSPPTFTEVTSSHASGLSQRGDRQALAADLNNDGHVDFVRNAVDHIEIWLNNGPGTWDFGNSGSPDVVLTGNLNTEGIVCIDVDGDGWLDLVTDNQQYGITLFTNPANGSANFSRASAGAAGLPSGGGSGNYMAGADIDVDGDIDFATRRASGEWDVYLNTAGTFAPHTGFDQSTTTGTDKAGNLLCDLDDDDDHDLLWLGNYNLPATGPNGAWAWNAGSWTFVTSLGSTTMQAGACLDADHDGDLDVALVGPSGAGAAQLYENRGGWSFASSGLPGGFTDSRSIGAVDYDQDGDLDLYINQTTTNELLVNDQNDSSYLVVRALTEVGTCPGGTAVRDDIGAVVRILNNGGAPLTGARSVSAGQGVGTQDYAAVHFGLPGGASNRVRVQIRYMNRGFTREVEVVPRDLGGYQQLDIIDVDLDGDGIHDIDEGSTDFDIDGVINSLDTDSDSDGIDDAVEAGDDDPCTPPVDTDGDFDPDFIDIDSDNDGIDDYDENLAGTSPILADTDGDGLTDAEEQTGGTDPVDPDSDDDGLNDGDELAAGSSPHDQDSDSDGLTDGEEVHTWGSNPIDPDSDQDLLPDGDEVNIYGSDPTKVNSDGDVLSDYDEVNSWGTDPALSDTDGDGVNDDLELLRDNTNPLVADTDGDGLDDGDEITEGTDPHDADTDLDGLEDGAEVWTHNTDPLDPDTDGGGALDGAEVYYDLTNPLSGSDDDLSEDFDLDGVSDGNERALGMDFQKADSDSDGVDDGTELPDPTDPLDSDGDGIIDALDTDDDGDGVPTSDEVGLNTDLASEQARGDPEVPDYLDRDDDNDTIPTLVEGSDDFDGDGIPNHRDTDADGDLTPDFIEGVGDDDNDGLPNFLDDFDNSDSDGDGLFDYQELSGALGTNPNDPDSDGDGVEDGDEVGPSLTSPYDTDDDGTIDALDVDDDDDGILTEDEDTNGNGDWFDDDVDGDGIPDYRDLSDLDGPKGDADGDGWTNAEEDRAGSDWESADTDGDGVGDDIELDDPDDPRDSDGDGRPDVDDPDDDNDGIRTLDETDKDFDGDGIPNHLDLDSDGDGALDAAEGKGDVDNDGQPDFLDNGGDVGPQSEVDTKVDYGFGCGCATPSPMGWGAWLIPLWLVRRRR